MSAAANVNAVVVMKGSDGCSGVVQFQQSVNGGPTTITGKFSGLKPGKHGFHIHQFGGTIDRKTPITNFNFQFHTHRFIFRMIVIYVV
jgi:Cu/Zn superoxide dismutase